MILQRLKVLIAASGIVAAAMFTAARVTAEDSPLGPTATNVFCFGQVPSHLDQPPSKPILEKPFAQGPSSLLLFRAGRLVLLDPDGRGEKDLTAGREAVHGDVRISADGKKVAMLIRSEANGSEHQKLRIRAFDENETGTDLGVECKTLVSVAWSPDGAEIAFADIPEDRKQSILDCRCGLRHGPRWRGSSHVVPRSHELLMVAARKTSSTSRGSQP